jgi:methylmalonyl-CoA mutase N-terminal domain/subunit
MHALMGILGGDQAIHTACWDEAYAIPSEKSALLALRTQQILAEECGLASTTDPLAGSYFVESLTSQIESQAAKYLETIDGMGGMLAAIENGYVHKEIQESSVEFQKRVHSGQRTIVGLNKYESTAEDGVDREEFFELDSKVEPDQKAKLAKVKEQRDQGAVAASLQELAGAIEADENLMPSIIKATKCYATIGEICGVMRDKWGEFTPPTYI